MGEACAETKWLCKAKYVKSSCVAGPHGWVMGEVESETGRPDWRRDGPLCLNSGCTCQVVLAGAVVLVAVQRKQRRNQMPGLEARSRALIRYAFVNTTKEMAGQRTVGTGG